MKILEACSPITVCNKSTIGEIKDVTLVLCAHPEIRTTLSIQVIDMPVRNYSIILGRDWQALTGGYLSLDGTHLSVPGMERIS
jgi:hypothetical protein